LSHQGRAVAAALEQRGASFLRDLAPAAGLILSEVEDALWELAAAGLVTADGFDNLRALIDPKRRNGQGRGRFLRPRHAAGRWALLRRDSGQSADDALEAIARQLLRRWGVVFRDLIVREEIAPAWRELLNVFRRMEARGDNRGGRFVDGFIGEQFALPEAAELLRDMRRTVATAPLVVASADPLNLIGVVTPGARVSTLAGRPVEVVA
jgi:ATP-dependent Lhr-like helicase